MSTKPSQIKKLSNSNWIALDKRKTATLDMALSSGASNMLLHQDSFFLYDKILKFQYLNSRGNKRHVGYQEQFKSWEETWKDPFALPFNYFISSTVNDIRAQMAAIRMMLRAVAIGNSQGRGRVTWHQIFGGVSSDKLRDSPRNPTISFLILSNIPNGSTQYKMEKLRDILCKYDSIPKIIVSSDESPMQLAQDIKIPVNHALYLGNEKSKLGKTRSSVSRRVNTF